MDFQKTAANNQRSLLPRLVYERGHQLQLTRARLALRFCISCLNFLMEKHKPMTAKFATTIMGTLIIILTCAAVASAAGQLFVTGWDTPIKRLDSQTFELLGEISANPNHGQLCCHIQIDSYRQNIWKGNYIYDFEGNLVIESEPFGDSYSSSVDPIGNTLWILNHKY